MYRPFNFQVPVVSVQTETFTDSFSERIVNTEHN